MVVWFARVRLEADWASPGEAGARGHMVRNDGLVRAPGAAGSSRGTPSPRGRAPQIRPGRRRRSTRRPPPGADPGGGRGDHGAGGAPGEGLRQGDGHAVVQSQSVLEQEAVPLKHHRSMGRSNQRGWIFSRRSGRRAGPARGRWGPINSRRSDRAGRGHPPPRGAPGPRAASGEGCGRRPRRGAGGSATHGGRSRRCRPRRGGRAR
jgi:hypothetical protein